jgi:hypothetical protein
MDMKRRILSLGGAGVLAVCGAVTAQEVAVDPLTGLKMAPGWELVRNNCVTCHSAKQFLQQKGTRETWRSVILWMQGRAGLWPLDAKTEAGILDYLESNHGPGAEFRRAPIPANLMPPNPYASAARKEYEDKVKKAEVKQGKP